MVEVAHRTGHRVSNLGLKCREVNDGLAAAGAQCLDREDEAQRGRTEAKHGADGARDVGAVGRRTVNNIEGRNSADIFTGHLPGRVGRGGVHCERRDAPSNRRPVHAHQAMIARSSVVYAAGLVVSFGGGGAVIVLGKKVTVRLVLPCPQPNAVTARGVITARATNRFSATYFVVEQPGRQNAEPNSECILATVVCATNTLHSFGSLFPLQPVKTSGVAESSAYRLEVPPLKPKFSCAWAEAGKFSKEKHAFCAPITKRRGNTCSSTQLWNLISPLL